MIAPISACSMRDFSTAKDKYGHFLMPVGKKKVLEDFQKLLDDATAILEFAKKIG